MKPGEKLETKRQIVRRFIGGHKMWRIALWIATQHVIPNPRRSVNVEHYEVVEKAIRDYLNGKFTLPPPTRKRDGR